MSYDLWGRLRYMLSPQFDIYEQVAKVVHGKVADIGCGTGFGTHLFARNAKVDGYEIDETARDFAQRAFSNGKVRFFEGDIIEISKMGFRYDFVTMIDVIEHISNHVAAIKSCKRLLDKNGTFICSTPNRLSRYRKSKYHVREYSPVELLQLLESVFDEVSLVDFELKPSESDYTNPIVAICV
ncbi:MAG: hypothetical protein BBJ57_02195 [Desulfobacterales bacterium PC51MH44]|nr:MAG: hypothetical protein BBJ57_02195 [Desulfobacterales bacterium PC51MH44]